MGRLAALRRRRAGGGSAEGRIGKKTSNAFCRFVNTCIGNECQEGQGLIDECSERKSLHREMVGWTSRGELDGVGFPFWGVMCMQLGQLATELWQCG